MTMAPLNSVKLRAGALALLALGIGAGYWWAHHTMTSNPAGGAPTASANMENTSSHCGARMAARGCPR